MENLVLAVFSQALLFIPLALGLSISFNLMRATDMTLDGSFVLGAAVFAKSVTFGVSPLLSFILALLAGVCAGMLVSFIQRGGKVDPLMAGILATFILTSANLLIMGRPNISLLSKHTLISDAFSKSERLGWSTVIIYCALICMGCYLLLITRFGLILRGLGDNPLFLQRLASPVEQYRLAGFALTNMLAATSGVMTAQIVGYADISMGMGMTLTGVGAIIAGKHIFQYFFPVARARIWMEFAACLIGVVLYFFIMNGLLRLNINPVYSKMLSGTILVLFLRSAARQISSGARYE